MTFWGFDTFAMFLLFARVGAMVMLLPGFGEGSIPPRVRLAFALALSVALAPVVGGHLPKAPAEFGTAVSLLIGELLIGMIIGGGARMLMAALSTAGQIVGLETGLSFAQTTDPTQGQAGQVVSVFLGVMGVAMIFATNLHHEFIRAIVNSYQAFEPAHPPSVSDATEYSIRLMGDSFRIGVQIAAPLMLAGLVYRIGLGVLSRLIPQIQVFFVAMPINVLGGFVIFALALSAGVLVWLDRLQTFAQTLQ
jgi:flagellar biosynthetic protein FliR